jgi:hypothetical protein
VTDDLTYSHPTAKADRPSGEYLTRRQSAEYIREELGRPFSFSTACTLAALGEFAAPSVWWGRRPLYTRDALRVWAEARSRPMKQRTERAAFPKTQQHQLRYRPEKT